MVLYKTEKEIELARQEKVESQAKTLKKFVYPFWTIAIIINSLLLIGYYKQEELIKRNSEKLRARERLRANEQV